MVAAILALPYLLPLYSFLSHNYIVIIIYNTSIFFGKKNILCLDIKIIIVCISEAKL